MALNVDTTAIYFVYKALNTKYINILSIGLIYELSENKTKRKQNENFVFASFSKIMYAYGMVLQTLLLCND